MQPIVSVSTGVAHAFEALARFQTRVTSSPLHWFALADEFGVRDRLELACLEAALGHLPNRPAGAALSVNLSGPLLLDTRTAELHATGDLNGLILEMTENSLLDDSPGLCAEISRLLALGVRFAVDDMGAGYSGLRQITTLRPSYLKLDRSLITSIDGDPARAVLVTALLGYAARRRPCASDRLAAVDRACMLRADQLRRIFVQSSDELPGVRRSETVSPQPKQGAHPCRTTVSRRSA